ncbi:dnaJ protein homolog isoform X2 [Henckelia pumila]|uniref:dnaJ protein homolog isoform X2 n=1 Tax=Henckelia pumila TaxID=405737 RepID=UPI003C6E886C
MSGRGVYYEILGVPKTATPDDLKKAFKKEVIKNHPDKGGDPENFKELVHAYRVLSDPAKRMLYDSEDAHRKGMDLGRMHFPSDIFSPFCGVKRFGGGSCSMVRRQRRRGEDMVYPLKVSLEELYSGTTKKLSLSRDVICSECDGKGSKAGASMECSSCEGSGVGHSIKEHAPGVFQRMQSSCRECGGTGKFINYKNWCPQCKGDAVVQERKVLEVHIEKGMQNGQKVTFPGEADEAPDLVTGDIVIVLEQEEHPKFKRKGDDLFVEHTLSLPDALCGCQFVLNHLDGRQLPVESQPGEIMRPGSCKAINDEGMPIYQRPFAKGKLYIHFNEEFPDSLSPYQVQATRNICPPKSLGVPKTATPDDLNKVLKKEAIKNHPDKGGDLENFKELVHTYCELSDPAKRMLYNSEDLLRKGMGRMHFPSDISSSFCGGSSSMVRRQRRRGRTWCIL